MVTTKSPKKLTLKKKPIRKGTGHPGPEDDNVKPKPPPPHDDNVKPKPPPPKPPMKPKS